MRGTERKKREGHIEHIIGAPNIRGGGKGRKTDDVREEKERSKHINSDSYVNVQN